MPVTLYNTGHSLLMHVKQSVSTERSLFAHTQCLMEAEGVHNVPGCVVQSVTSLNTDPGVASLTLVWSHTFMEIDHEIISKVILLLPLIQEGLLSATSESMCTQYKYWLTACTRLPRKKCG